MEANQASDLLHNSNYTQDIDLVNGISFFFLFHSIVQVSNSMILK